MEKLEVIKKQIELLGKVNEELMVLPMNPEVAAQIRENVLAINQLSRFL